MYVVTIITLQGCDSKIMALFPYTSLKQFGVNNEFFFNLKKINEKIMEQKWTNVLSTNAMSNVHVGTKLHPDWMHKEWWPKNY